MKNLETKAILKDLDAYLTDFAERYADGLIDMAQIRADMSAQPTTEAVIYFHDADVFEGLTNEIPETNNYITELLWDLAYSANGYICDELIKRGCDVYEEPAGTFRVTIPLEGF